MKNYDRIFVIVLDSLGIGAMPDSAKFGDIGVDIQVGTGFMNLFTLPSLRLSLGLKTAFLGLLPLTIPVGIAINCSPGAGFFFLVNGHYDSSFAVLV